MARSKDPAKRVAKRRRRAIASAERGLRVHRGRRDGPTRERELLQERAVKRAGRCTVCDGRGQVMVRTAALVSISNPEGCTWVTARCGACEGAGHAEE